MSHQHDAVMEREVQTLKTIKPGTTTICVFTGRLVHACLMQHLCCKVASLRSEVGSLKSSNLLEKMRPFEGADTYGRQQRGQQAQASRSTGLGYSPQCLCKLTIPKLSLQLSSEVVSRV